MSRYDIELDLESRNSLSILLKHIDKESTVLEFGPANGRLTRHLKNKLGCHVYAVEIDAEAALDLREYSKECIVGDIESYEWRERFKDIKFDTIIFADVLEHLYYPEKVLVESKEFLKEDGNILVSLPNIAHNAIVMELLRDKFTYSKTGLLDNTHIRFFTHSSFLETIERCGLFCSYESGVYAKANETEFGYEYEDFEMGKILEQREFGEVYQFVYELKKSPFKEKISDFDERYKKEKVWGIAKLYVDTGSGFCEENSLEIKNPQNKELLEFDISGFDNIKNLRFDPFDAAVCLVPEETEMIFEDGSSRKIVPVSNNSCFAGSSVDCFLTNDSRYIYFVEEKTENRIKKVVFKCDYKYIAKNAVDEIEKISLIHSRELHDIKNSKGWKFILFIRKLKGFFNA